MTPAPAEWASSLRPRAEEPTGEPASNKLPALEPKEAAQSEELALVQRRRLPAPPGFTLSWVDEFVPGSGPAGKHTPGPIGSYLLGVPAGDHLSLPSDRGGMISVPNLGQCPDIPTTDLAQALGPT